MPLALGDLPGVIRDEQVAKGVIDLMIEFSVRLDGSIAAVRDQCLGEGFTA